MAEVLAFGTFWFWVLVTAEFVVLLACMNWDNGFAATVSLGIVLGLMYWFGDLSDAMRWAVGHPYHIAGVIAGYGGVGAGWAIAKWWLYVHDRVDEYRRMKSIYMADGKATDETWRAFAGTKPWAKAPLASDNKAKIVRWISFWPASMLWSLVDDFVRRVAIAIYNFIAEHLQGMSDKAFEGIRDELNGGE